VKLARGILDIWHGLLCRSRRQKPLGSAGDMEHSLGTRDPIHVSRRTGDFHTNYAFLRNELWAHRKSCLPGHRMRHTKLFTLVQRALGTMQLRPARLRSVLCHPADPSEAHEVGGRTQPLLNPFHTVTRAHHTNNSRDRHGRPVSLHESEQHGASSSKDG